MSVRPAKTQISLGIRPVWSESSLCAQWVAKSPRFLHTDSEDSDQTGRMPRLIWVFAGRILTLLVLSCRGSLVIVFILLFLVAHCDCIITVCQGVGFFFLFCVNNNAICKTTGFMLILSSWESNASHESLSEEYKEEHLSDTIDLCCHLKRRHSEVSTTRRTLPLMFASV